ncbi:MAG: C-terminal helicase domain-containing protein [bacterium]
MEQIEEVKLEVGQIQNVVDLASKIKVDTKTIKLLEVLKNIFSKISNKKVLIFIENLETQYYLYKILKEKYNIILYNGEYDYSSIKEFKENKEVNILISTDSGARGFNIQECNIVIHYDLLYNTFKDGTKNRQVS